MIFTGSTPVSVSDKKAQSRTKDDTLTHGDETVKSHASNHSKC